MSFLMTMSFIQRWTNAKTRVHLDCPIHKTAHPCNIDDQKETVFIIIQTMFKNYCLCLDEIKPPKFLC